MWLIKMYTSSNLAKKRHATMIPGPPLHAAVAQWGPSLVLPSYHVYIIQLVNDEYVPAAAPPSLYDSFKYKD